MNWIKEGKIYKNGVYEIEKVKSKWVVFWNRMERPAIHKAKSLDEAKIFCEGHLFRIAL
jgi:hypothetical protein